jgi:hypothetical protein
MGEPKSQLIKYVTDLMCIERTQWAEDLIARHFPDLTLGQEYAGGLAIVGGDIDGYDWFEWRPTLETYQLVATTALDGPEAKYLSESGLEHWIIEQTKPPVPQAVDLAGLRARYTP